MSNCRRYARPIRHDAPGTRTPPAPPTRLPYCCSPATRPSPPAAHVCAATAPDAMPTTRATPARGKLRRATTVATRSTASTAAPVFCQRGPTSGFPSVCSAIAPITTSRAPIARAMTCVPARSASSPSHSRVVSRGVSISAAPIAMRPPAIRRATSCGENKTGHSRRCRARRARSTRRACRARTRRRPCRVRGRRACRPCRCRRRRRA